MIVIGLLGIILITVLRMVIGLVGKAMSDAFQGQMGGGTGDAAAAGGELRKCEVCGTYVPPANAPKVRGVKAFLCSDACVRKFQS